MQMLLIFSFFNSVSAGGDQCAEVDCPNVLTQAFKQGLIKELNTSVCHYYLCPSESCVYECGLNYPGLSNSSTPENLSCEAMCKNSKRMHWNPEFNKCTQNCQKLLAENVPKNPFQKPENACFNMCDLPNPTDDANTCYNNALWKFQKEHDYKVTPDFCEYAENYTNKPNFDKCYMRCRDSLLENEHNNPLDLGEVVKKCKFWCGGLAKTKCHNEADWLLNHVHDYNVNPVFCTWALRDPTQRGLTQNNEQMLVV